MQRVSLSGDYSISRIIKGGWHLAGGHGDIDPAAAQRDMAAFVDAGVTTFDCADIYTGVESLIGGFRRNYPEHARKIQVHTKFVPDLSDLARVDRGYVENIVHRSMMRLGVEQLDMVQFHWWDYQVPGYVETALELDRLRRAGQIRHLGLTNFDVAHLSELTKAGVRVVSHQVQYSLVDDRATHGMVDFCRDSGIRLLCYGTVCGGFLSERWLGRPAPAAPLENRSLAKYRLVIDEFGGWELFQELLRALRVVAAKHGSDIASVATRLILDRAQVAAAIVGAVDTRHLGAHANVGDLVLDDEDRRAIEAVTRQRRGPKGDIYELERDRNGVHGRIMKYDLNVPAATPGVATPSS
jgi:aryl-alcohol dehydrogenase-like predicted oxidoreductase